MKVVCSACELEYSIPDRRVSGRKVKFRCKKCASDVVVDGTKLGPPLPLSSPAIPAATGRHRVAEPAQPAPAPKPPRPNSSPAQRAALAPPSSKLTPANDWALLEAPTRPGAKSRSAVASWVVDLGGHVHETMLTEEICELYARGTLTASSPIRAVGNDQWSPLSSKAEVIEALRSRGIPLLARIERPAADDAEPTEEDFAAPTRQLKADDLWAAAGIRPEALKRVRDREPDDAHDAETAMIDQRAMLAAARGSRKLPSLKPPGPVEESETNPVHTVATLASAIDPAPAQQPPTGVDPPPSMNVAGMDAPASLAAPLAALGTASVSARSRFGLVALVAAALLVIVGVGVASLVMLWPYFSRPR